MLVVSTARLVAHGLLAGCLLAPVALAGCSDDGGWPKLAAIPLTNPDGSFWGPKLTVGDQTFLVQLDTGSTTTAIAGTACSSCASIGVTPLYMPAGSAKDDQLTATAEYADMSGWTGEIYTDKVSLGVGTPSLSYAIADINDSEMSFFYDSNGYQGILGFGAPENALPNTGAYVATAEQSGAVPTMAFELCANDGTMWLGGFDQSKAASAPVYTPLLAITKDQPFYAIGVSSMALGSTTIATSADFQSDNGPPVVDTGTTFFSAPTAVVTSTLAAVNASPGFKALFGSDAELGTLESQDMGCVTATSVTADMVDAMLPALTFTFPAKTAGAPDVSVTARPTESYLLDFGDGQWCFGLDDSGDDSTTLGDSILQAFVTIIDLDNQQVGWAPDLGCSVNPQHRAIDRSAFRPHLPHPRPLRR